MNRKIVLILLILLALWLLAGCDNEKRIQTTASVPAYGSLASGQTGFDNATSEYHPANNLSESGVLKGKWLGSDKIATLEVSLDKERMGAGTISYPKKDGTWVTEQKSYNFPNDHFLITIGKDMVYPFEAAYEEFLLFPCDIDNDGTDEIILEHGLGRGTAVYVRFLSILKIIDDELTEVLSIPLNGYLPCPEDPGGMPWQRKYHFILTFSGTYDVAVTLIPPVSVPDFLATEERLQVLQHPKLILSYDFKRRSFLIKKEELKSGL
jgi:hypothetical protein